MSYCPKCHAIFFCICGTGDSPVDLSPPASSKYEFEFHNPDGVNHQDLQQDSEGRTMRLLTTDEHRQLLMTGCWSGRLEIWQGNHLIQPNWLRNNHAGFQGLCKTMRTSNPMPQTIEEAVKMGKEYAT